jgi:4-hydroxy-tetrahydrodipicolinate synthase
MDLNLHGSIVALVTPFQDSGEVDYKALEDLILWHVEEGSDGIVLCGTTGEAPTLSHEEKMEIFRVGVKGAKGKVPLIAGTGTYNTRQTVQDTESALKIGVDAALIVVPYYNRPTPEGCLAHYAEVSKVGLPLIIYHHPGRTGVKLSVDTLAEICSLPNIAALKEASGFLEITKELKSRVSVPIFSGDDPLTLPLMELGAAGVISIVANLIPRAWKKLVQDVDITIQDKYADLCKAMVLETNPQCVKYALSLLGKCKPYLRLPLVEPRPSTKEAIEAAISLLREEQSRI